MNAQTAHPFWIKESQLKLEKELTEKYGESQKARLQRGIRQAADFWQEADGGPDAFENFIRTNFAGDQATLDVMFNRFEYLFEKLAGHMNEIGLAFREQSDLDHGPIYPFDEIFAAYSPGSHINDDFLKNKLAFIVLLNFPLTTLEERLTNGDKWSRREWAEARLAQGFSRRIPAEVNQAVAEASAVTDQYISEYNIYMHHLIDSEDKRLFPPKMRLLSHWNLRDELKADYNDRENGPEKQKMIAQVMERIVTQTIPEIVVNNPGVDWNPYTNEVKPAAVIDFNTAPVPDQKINNSPEPDTRYAVLLKAFQAVKKEDPYSPTAPTLIARQFNENREIPEDRVKSMLESVLKSPLVPKVAKLIEKRLGRPLEPYDIWYNGFRPKGKYSEAQLDEIVRKKYPTAEAYKADMPNMLLKLGFSKDRAEYITGNIMVDPARGSGHAAGAAMRSAKAHLRTRVSKEGMDYKGFNIAVHEMGHNVEQTLSLNDMDHYFLNGVPNTAFTEAVAFVFQAHDLDLLGMSAPDPQKEALKRVYDFWMVYEIAGVSLVDMEIWHWMYDHPNATPAELKSAMLQIAKNIWNTYYTPVFNKKDVVLLAIYSHIIHSFLYIPDYAIGHLISSQIETQIQKSGNIGAELERIIKSGSIAPDLWMKNATGLPVGSEELLNSTKLALEELNK
ncbi:MAG: hypothetical protein JXA06_09050 [Bacteroidetes bacterium]|nr:hypothetical protein [Bacteroidota bacterium]